MKKYVFAKTGESISLGDVLGRVVKTSMGNAFIPVKVTESIIPTLIEEGVIKEVDEEADCTHINIEYYVEHLAKRINWKPANLSKYLNNLANVNEAALFSILLREVAIVLDKKYPDHIEKSKEIYVISLADGEIHKVKELHKIKNFRNFAAFRTVNDAICAKNILKPFMIELFKRGGK